MQGHNKAKAEAMLNDLKFHIITGSCYLGGFIGEASAQQSWIKEKTKTWAESITKLAMVGKQYPQAAYTERLAEISAARMTVLAASHQGTWHRVLGN